VSLLTASVQWFDLANHVFDVVFAPKRAYCAGTETKPAHCHMSIRLRPSQALTLWHQVALSEIRDDAPDLTLRQTSILLSIYLEPPPHTVRGLAAKHNVTKPVITRALDAMGSKKLVTRHRDPRDKRNVVISRTVDGALYLERLADVIISKARDLPL
jgi:DNA-binding MarR family transcriptional regulator